MNLDAHTWVLGKDYTQAPTCATCHMLDTCPIVKSVHKLHDKVIGFLRGLTLEDFIDLPQNDFIQTQDHCQPEIAGTKIQS